MTGGPAPSRVHQMKADPMIEAIGPTNRYGKEPPLTESLPTVQFRDDQ